MKTTEVRLQMTRDSKRDSSKLVHRHRSKDVKNNVNSLMLKRELETVRRDESKLQDWTAPRTQIALTTAMAASERLTHERC